MFFHALSKQTIRKLVTYGLLLLGTEIGYLTAANINVVQADVNSVTSQVTFTDTPLAGVVTVKNQAAPLYNDQGQQIADRILIPHSAWRTVLLHVSSDGHKYYQVSTHEYIAYDQVTFQSGNVDGTAHPLENEMKPGSGNADVCIIKGSGVTLYNGYGANAVSSGRTLASGSAWKVLNHVYANGHYWYEVGDNAWVNESFIVVIHADDYQPAVHLQNVPLIAQRPELPNGCEITAVTMMLQYAGAKVDKMQLAREMPRSKNPNYGYIGDPWNGTGVTIFPPALMRLVQNYTPNHTAKDLTGLGFDAIKYQLGLGHPVVTWNTMHGFPYHALVITGYDNQYVYYNDCWTNKRSSWSINSFVNNWNSQAQRAISY